jgi:phosphoheptose isomerase
MKAASARPAEETVDLPARIRRQFSDSAQLKLKAIDVLVEPIVRATEIMVRCLLANGKILACGNGGSAADSQPLRARTARFGGNCPDYGHIHPDCDCERL